MPASGLPSLKGKHIILGVTGGIAAYKSAELARQLIKQGAEVQVVMTESAREFVQPLTFQALTGKPVHTSQWRQDGADRGMPHIDLGRWADIFLIAPCTANTLSKLASGLAGNLLENLLLARNCPAAIAPAMNVEMWNNPSTQRNLQQLKADGYSILGPGVGEQACGEIGAGRMLEPEELVLEMARLLTQPTLKNQTVLLTAGPTQEAIDPVRAITNNSSGKMGYSMALAAWLQGASVHLVSGPTALPVPYGVSYTAVKTAREMFSVVQTLLTSTTIDLFGAVAAVADYAIKNPSEHKQKKSDDGRVGLELDFELNPDILASVGQLKEEQSNPKMVVGFAAETRDLDTYAQKKLASKKADFIVGNLAQNAMGSDQNELSVYKKGHTQAISVIDGDKLDVSLKLFELLRANA